MSTARAIAAAVLLAGLAACHRPTVPSGRPAGAGDYVSPAVASARRPVGAFVRANLATPLVPASSCNLERIDREAFGEAAITVPASRPFLVAGYAYDAAHEQVPERLWLRAVAADGSAFEAPIEARLDRPDVPLYFAIGAWARRSGFELKLPAAALAPGDYRLLLTFAHGSQLYGCDIGRRLRIAG